MLNGMQTMGKIRRSGSTASSENNFKLSILTMRAKSQKKDKHKESLASPSSELKLSPIISGAVALIFLLFLQNQCSAQQIYRRRESNRLQAAAAQAQAPSLPVAHPLQHNNVVAEMQVLCHSDAIVLIVNTNTPFNGMLYAKDAPNGPNCLSEFYASTNMSFRVPLKSCGTLMAEVDDGVEFFNTIVVQPHMRLMTNQGKGYHIRCKYQTRERTIANTHFNVSAAFLMQNGPQLSSAPLLATASMPTCTMKIYRIDQDNVAESVRVGDKLVMVIEIDRQDMYGMRVTNCMVRDGLNKAEQQLINDAGCPVDETIMPKFEYEHNSTRAVVAFRAHKFPHTSSIYYQCNVRLCINDGGGGGCEQVVCPAGASASASSALVESPSAPVPALTGGTTPAATAASPATGGPRRKRFIGAAHKLEHETNDPGGPDDNDDNDNEPVPQPSEPTNMSFDVYSGLYVSDVAMSESNSGDPNGQQVLPAGRGVGAQLEGNPTSANTTSQFEQQTCLTVGKASLLVVFASLTSVALVLLIVCQAGLLSAKCSASDDEQHPSQRCSLGSLRELASELELEQAHQAQRQHARAQHLRQQRRSSQNNQPGRKYNSSRLLSSSTTSINGRSFSPFYQV